MNTLTVRHRRDLRAGIGQPPWELEGGRRRDPADTAPLWATPQGFLCGLSRTPRQPHFPKGAPIWPWPGHWLSPPCTQSGGERGRGGGRLVSTWEVWPLVCTRSSPADSRGPGHAGCEPQWQGHPGTLCMESSGEAEGWPPLCSARLPARPVMKLLSFFTTPIKYLIDGVVLYYLTLRINKQCGEGAVWDSQ